MKFANPAALWLLTLLIPLILLYLLKHRRNPIIVPSTQLWKQALEDLRVHTPFQRLRSNLLLLLQILILVLVTAILSQPYVPGSSTLAGRWILAMDTSASMKATDVKPDRFHAAREKLLRLLDSVPPEDEILLISFSSQASILQAFSRNHTAVRNQLKKLQPEDVAGNWRQLELLIQPLWKENPKPRIVIASDFANRPSGVLEQFLFDPVVVGQTGQNVAITRAVLRPLPEDPAAQILFYQLRNYGSQSRLVDVALTRDSDPLDAFQIRLDPMQNFDRSTEVAIPEATRIRINLSPEDFLPLDNDFVLYAKPQEKVRVQLKLKNPFLEKALRLLPSVQLSPSGGLSIAQLDSVTSAEKGSGIFFLPPSTAREAAAVIHWNRAHPAMRYVDPSLWQFQRPSTLQLPAEGILLLETASGPAAYALDQPGQRRIVLGFALEESNVPFMAGFPVFLQNSIEWISEGLHPPEPTLTGSEFRSEGPAGEDSYVNFADPLESNIAPQSVAKHSSPSPQLIVGRNDLSRWFLLVLLCILFTEWWAFHQKLEAKNAN